MPKVIQTMQGLQSIQRRKQFHSKQKLLSIFASFQASKPLWSKWGLQSRQGIVRDFLKRGNGRRKTGNLNSGFPFRLSVLIDLTEFPLLLLSFLENFRYFHLNSLESQGNFLGYSLLLKESLGSHEVLPLLHLNEKSEKNMKNRLELNFHYFSLNWYSGMDLKERLEDLIVKDQKELLGSR